MQKHRRTLLKRAAIWTGLLTPVAAAIASFASEATGDASNPFTLVVFLAKGCPFCERWLAQDKPALEAWPSRSRVRTYYVEKDSLRRPFLRNDFPRELEWVYSALSTEEKTVGVPAFRIYAGTEVVALEVGLSSWNRKVYPELRRLVGTSSGAPSPRAGGNS